MKTDQRLSATGVPASSLPDLLAGIRSRAAALRAYAELLETIAAELIEMPDPAAFAAIHDQGKPETP